ncbi:MAG: protein tyrosine phosphatase, partial [Lachnospiraceae bacterium]|nr:protein tyrosine phosphatase [Lachnospiraceae bacterium]
MEKHNMIDIHAHILPGVDDGARSMEEACELVNRLIEAGFTAIIATPHYSRRRGTEGYEAIFQELKEKLEKEY